MNGRRLLVLTLIIGAMLGAGASRARAQAADDGFAYVSAYTQHTSDSNWDVTVTYDFTYQPLVNAGVAYVVLTWLTGDLVSPPAGCTPSPANPLLGFSCRAGASGSVGPFVVQHLPTVPTLFAECDEGFGFPVWCGGATFHPHDTLPVSYEPPPDKGCKTGVSGVARPAGSIGIAANDQTCKKLRIFDVTDPQHAADITGQTHDAVVGQHLKLEARYEGGGLATGVTWSVPGLGDPLPAAIKTYGTAGLTDATAAVPAPTPLTAADLSQTDLDMFWTKASLGSGDTVAVSAPGAGPAQVTFNVRAPSFTWTASTCAVGINQATRIPGSQLVPPALALGFNDACTGPGILWDIHVTAPHNQGDGDIAVMQVVRSALTTHNAKTCVSAADKVDALDTGLPFYPTRAANETVPRGAITLAVASDQQVEWKSLDAPEIDLPTPIGGANNLTTPPFQHTYTLARGFQTYLMYKPLGDGNLWAPLAEMDWSFSGAATWQFNLLDPLSRVWSLQPGATRPPNHPPAVTLPSLAAFPTWSGRMPHTDPKCNVLGPTEMGARLTAAAAAGTTTLAVDSTDGMAAGAAVLIGMGGPSREQRIITALTPLTLNRPLRLAHTAGEPVVAELPGMADTTPPSCQVQVSPALITGANHQLVSVTATVTAGDDRGGTGLVPGVTGVTLAGGTGAGAISGFVPAAGSLTATGQVRADPGATYTVTYQVSDRAGNTASCAATIIIPTPRGS